MYRFIWLLLVVALLSGCGRQKTTPVDTAKEKQAIESAITKFGKAYESKDLSTMTTLLSTSGELMWFGTDSAEVIKSVAQWETQMKNDWQVFESVKFGEVRNLSIQVASDGQLASAVYEVPLDMTIGGQLSHALFRFGCALKKENGEWRYIQGVAGVATVGQSSAELVAKMKEAKK